MFWCSFKKKELLQGVMDFLRLVDPDFVHLDLSSGGIKLQTLWFFNVDLVIEIVKHALVPRLWFL